MSNPAVLVVEDDSQVASMVRAVLEAAGHTVHVTRSRADTLSFLPTLDPPPSVVLLDLGLPDSQGFGFAAELRALPELDGTRFILSSGSHAAPPERAITEAGFSAHLDKPYRMAELRATVARLVG